MTTTYTDFKQKHVIVTGAANGIGQAIALAFAEQNAVVGAWDIDEENLRRTCIDHDNLYPLVCDLSDPKQVASTHALAVAKHGEVSTLINNAGVDRRMSISEQSSQDWRWMLSVNLDHQAQLSALVAPAMKQHNTGAIINMSSTAWMKLAENLTAYHAAKAGVIGLTRGLARELGPYNIRVNAIAPGRVITERVANLVDEKWIEETKQLQCLKYLISPEDIAQTALWLASQSARSITGQTIIVDAGVT